MSNVESVELLTQIEAFAKMMIRPTVTTAEVKSALGGLEEPLNLTAQKTYYPADLRFALAELYLRPNANGAYMVSSLKLTIKPENNLSIAELRARFGDYRRMPPTPGGANQYAYTFHYPDETALLQATLIVSLDNNAEDEAAIVEQITILRADFRDSEPPHSALEPREISRQTIAR